MDTTETIPEHGDEPQQPVQLHVDISQIADLEVSVVQRVLRAVGLHLVLAAFPDDEPVTESPRFIIEYQDLLNGDVWCVVDRGVEREEGDSHPYLSRERAEYYADKGNRQGYLTSEDIEAMHEERLNP